MNTGATKSSAMAELDLSIVSEASIDGIDFDHLEKIIIQIPLPSFGVSNSHIDLCGDLLDASWALEALASCAQEIEMTMGSGYFQPKITAILGGLQPDIKAVVVSCASASRVRAMADAI